jgi:hypothetical protein
VRRDLADEVVVDNFAKESRQRYRFGQVYSYDNGPETGLRRIVLNFMQFGPQIAVNRSYGLQITNTRTGAGVGTAFCNLLK